ncbi:MAG: helix-hairpin-helix domain-containing protein [Saprospiraceae bacterium]|nr:helix-hairpin-helix domain-containing protein [Saprospiraceae bacterium]MCB9318940.1 helix-hairpin-helix domain-containing protein [Lewinellaceae bacterium]
MMSLKSFFAFPIVLLMAMAPLTAQEPAGEPDLSFVEDFLQNDEGVDAAFLDELMQTLRYRLEHPLNINKADYDALKSLFLLSDLQITEIIKHRILYGDYLSILELQSITALDVETIRRIAPFITIRDEESKSFNLPDLGRGDHEFVSRLTRTLEKRDGYIPDGSGTTSYLGDPNQINFRYRYRATNRFSLGVTAEKDAGESYWTAGQGPDFISAHASIRDAGKIKDLILGDYSIRLGQGLVINTRYNAGKSALVTNFAKGGRTLNPYGAINEFNFFRGVACTFEPIPHLQTTVFASRRQVGSSIFDVSDSLAIARTFDETGYHRTLSELNRKGELRMDLVGGAIQYQHNQLNVGLQTAYYHFSPPVDRRNDTYGLYYLHGNHLMTSSFDYRYVFKKAYLFGEVAYQQGHLAQVHGLLMSLSRRANLGLYYRNLSPEYILLQGDIFGESGVNEQGLYWGFEYQFNQHWSFHSYVDWFNYPWLRYRINKPSAGHEFLGRMRYYIKRKLEAYVQVRYEQKERNSSGSSDVPGTVQPSYLRRYRLHVDWDINRSWNYRSRLEYSHFNVVYGNKEQGWMWYHDFIYHPLEYPISLSGRIARFNTGGFDSRIYAYEQDLIYTFSIPFYYLKGWRYYLNARYKWEGFTFEVRVAQTRFDNRESIGTGPTKINVNHRTDLRAQLIYRF